MRDGELSFLPALGMQVCIFGLNLRLTNICLLESLKVKGLDCISNGFLRWTIGMVKISNLICWGYD